MFGGICLQLDRRLNVVMRMVEDEPRPIAAAGTREEDITDAVAIMYALLCNGPIRSYRYTVTLEYVTIQKCTFDTKCTAECRPRFSRVRYSGSSYGPPLPVRYSDHLFFAAPCRQRKLERLVADTKQMSVDFKSEVALKGTEL
jgi:hypothetical protein